ncbi:MAG: PIN domain-containing protein [Acetatifactor muris]|nr:PIN domain-containing protein [Acetatifactor muris]
MLLVDTNVFIDFWNHPTEEITKTFEKEDIAICGVIRTELLHGAVSEKDFNEITTMLGAFDELSIEHADWQLLGAISV